MWLQTSLSVHLYGWSLHFSPAIWSFISESDVNLTFPALIDRLSVRHLILDEADRMLDSEFLLQVQEITAACTHNTIQKAVFSATLPANAEKIAMAMLHDPIRVVVGLKCVLLYRPSCIANMSLFYSGIPPFLSLPSRLHTSQTTHQNSLVSLPTSHNPTTPQSSSSHPPNLVRPHWQKNLS